MIVTCLAARCPYNDHNGFCGKPVMISINEMGACSVLWKGLQARSLAGPLDDKDLYTKEARIIEDAAIKVDDTVKTNIQEGEESRSEDPQNDATA